MEKYGVKKSSTRKKSAPGVWLFIHAEHDGHRQRKWRKGGCRDAHPEDLFFSPFPASKFPCSEFFMGCCTPVSDTAPPGFISVVFGVIISKTLVGIEV